MKNLKRNHKLKLNTKKRTKSKPRDTLFLTIINVCLKCFAIRNKVKTISIHINNVHLNLNPSQSGYPVISDVENNS